MCVRHPADFDELRSRLKEPRFALFLGSGLSRPAFPSWQELAQRAADLARKYGMDDNPLDALPLPDQLEHCKHQMPDDAWLRFLDEIFARPVGPEDASEAYRLLAQSPQVRHVVTTNLDALPTVLWPGLPVFSNSESELGTLLRRLDKPAGDRFVLQLHGCHSRPDTWVLTASDYRRILHGDRVRALLSAILSSFTLLFVGFGFGDKHLDLILGRLRELMPGGWKPSFALVPNLTRPVYDRLIREYGVHALGYPAAPKGDHTALVPLLEEIFSVPSRAREAPAAPVPSTASGGGLADALPLAGLTRLLYTCRGRIEVPPFACPDLEQEPPGLLVATTHLPVDEIETHGLCLHAYGEVILGESEERVRGFGACSAVAASRLTALAQCEGEIHEMFLENLLIVGENLVANSLFSLVCHDLPWRHLVAHVRLVGFREIAAAGSQEYRVWPCFRADEACDVTPEVRRTLTSDSYNWGLLTYTHNPFAPEKRLLLLAGCRREVGRLGRLSLLVRQTRLTRWSLQVLIDVQSDQPPEVFAHGGELTPMDRICEFCRAAVARAEGHGEVFAKVFNLNRAPFPLHLTLLRLPAGDATPQAFAGQWARAHARRVWGRLEGVELTLTKALRAPFQEVTAVPLP